ncbi:MAG: hypothetical protein IJ932_01680 [Ruminococcus sp.]|nr:hypothetical protein [Ruminococcus sp.]
MKNLFEKKVNLILIIVILIVAILIGIPLVSRGCATSTSNGEIVTKPATADEATTEATTQKPTKGVDIKDAKVKIQKKKAGSSSTASASTKSDPRKSSAASKTKKKKSSSSLVYATAPKVEEKASHTAQWNAGYLVAIDNPDTSYSCEHIELSDKDRELLEKLCMGELGSGGFTGAALIAQAVKNAMYFEGYTNVRDVINNLHYTGKLTTPTKRVKDAVVYVFDMDKNAIQHRILYMYNPELMKDNYSKFHESQRYICTYQDVRFFDK